MLTHAFLIAWYTTMLSRVEKAGNLIVHSTRSDFTTKNDGTPVTGTDLGSSEILTKDWTLTPIISEENKSPIQNETLMTWVDPLDATQEFTENLTEYVSIMACLTENGLPVAGILHFPFRKETWAAINGTWLERPAMEFNPAPEVIVSRSHRKNQERLSGYPLIYAGGSGYKAAEVMKGHVRAYIHTSKIKTWDICAIDAFARASSATFVTWPGNKELRYTKAIQTEGLFFSTTSTLIQFKLKELLMKKEVQCVFVVMAWLLIYVWPDNINTDILAPVVKKSKKLTLAACIIGLLACYIIWGIAQERIMSFDYDGDKFHWPAVLIFVNRFIASGFASVFVKKQTTPFFKLSVASFTNVISSLCQYSALKHVIFPIVVVFKSLKMIPVLIVGKYLFKKKYKSRAYVLALFLAFGVSLSLYSSRSNGKEIAPIGIILMLGYVFFDAITSQWQSYIFKKYNTPPFEMMYGITTCSTIFTGVMVLFSGQIDASIAFSSKHPIFLAHLLGLCIPGVLGQWFIFKTIEHHGAATFSMIMTGRQAISLVASCIIFGHTLAPLSIVGVAIVFCVFFIKNRTKIEYNTSKTHVYSKIPFTDEPTEEHVD